MVSTLPVDDLLRNLSIKDLRMQCRARGINPAGNADSLRERIQEDMNRSSDYTIHQHAPEPWQQQAAAQAVAPPPDASRPPSSRNAYGTGAGASQIHFGDYKTDYSTQQYGQPMAPAAPPSAPAGEHAYHAPNPGSRGYSSGGGQSQVSFGDYQLPSSHPQPTRAAPVVPVKSEEDKKHEEVSISVSEIVKPLLLKDLRIQLRARGLSPAGSVEELRQRLAEDMMRTGNTSLALDVNLVNPYAQGVVPPPSATPSGTRTPAGGQSQISFGDYTLPSQQQQHQVQAPWESGNAPAFRPSSRQFAQPPNQIHFG